MRINVFRPTSAPRVLGWFVLAILGIALKPYGAVSQEPLVVQPDQDGIQRATINMESYVYSPKALVVQSGKPVELILQNNSFLVPHNFLLDSPDGKRVIEEDISSGDTETVHFTFTTPGTYPFYCNKQLLFFPNHREEGMEGRIVVR